MLTNTIHKLGLSAALLAPSLESSSHQQDLPKLDEIQVKRIHQAPQLPKAEDITIDTFNEFGLTDLTDYLENN